MNKYIGIEVFSNYAHFRKFNTTSSPRTYKIIPKPAAIGIIGAILGIDKKELYNLYSEIEDIKIALDDVPETININQLALLIKKDKEFLFPLQTKQPRTRLKIEYVKTPKYRLYVKFKDKNLKNKFKEMVMNHITTYPIYLGVSECIANYKYLGENGLNNGSFVSNEYVKNAYSEYQPININENNQYVKFNNIYWAKK